MKSRNAFWCCFSDANCIPSLFWVAAVHSLKEDWKDAMAWSRESVGLAFPLKVWTLSATGRTERVVCGLYDDRTLDNSLEGIVLTLMCSGDFSSVINLRHARRLDKVRTPLHH